MSASTLSQSEIELILETIVTRKSQYEDDKRRCELSKQDSGEYYNHKVRMIKILTAIEAKLTVTEELPAPKLTDEQAEVLETINNDDGGVKFAVPKYCIQLNKLDYVLCETYNTDARKGTYWYITEAGRAALEAHTASKEGKA